MKVTITQLKAPWPEGAGVGSVVELQADQVPACFEGKCVPAKDDAEATATWAPVVHPVEEPAEPAKLPASQEDLQVARALQAAAEAEAADLRKLLEAKTAELAAMAEQLKAAQAAAEAAQAKKK